MALAERNDPAVADVLDDFLRSNEQAETFRGCFLGEKALSGELCFWATGHLSVTDSADLHTLNLLNGVLLNCKPRDVHEKFLVWRALESNRAYPPHYERVRQLAEEDVYLAPEALAEYRKREDIPLILEQDEPFCAIANFPDPAFRELVRSRQASDSSSCYLKAVAAYADEEAVAFLTRFGHGGTEETDFLIRALSERYDPIFRPLAADTWLKRGVISPELITFLSADSVAAAKMFAAGMTAHTTIRMVGERDYVDEDEEVVRMLQVISRHAPESMPAVCAQRIANADYFELKFYLKYVTATRSEDMFAPLQQFIEGSALPGNIHGIAEAFLSWNDPEITARITGVVKAQHAKWDQSGWANRVYDLFAAYGVSLK